MKADQRQPVPTTPEQATATPPDTAPGISAYISYRLIGVVLLVVLLIAAWWYASTQSKQASSKLWSEFARTGVSQAELEALGGAGNKFARLELARSLYGPQGLALLQPNDQEQRNKGIANIAKARDEFVALADLFKGDVTLRASCLVDAAEAELTLVGLPKDGSSAGSQGSVEKAAEYYKSAAEAVSAQKELAEQYRQRADELIKNKATIEQLGSEIINRLAPAPTFNVGPNPNGPKAPEGPIPTPKPPETTTPNPDAPKAPTAPVTPPMTGTEPKQPAKEAPKEPMKEAPKEAPKEPMKEAPKAPPATTPDPNKK